MEVSEALNSNNSASQPQAGPQRPKKKRVRHWTAEDRAVHREFEKSRREAFSERLTELTKLLPTLEEDTRPSKHIIVDASISYHKTQQSRCQKATSTIQALLAERDDLIREVNSLRSLYSPGASVPRQPQPIDPAVLDLLNGGDTPDFHPSEPSTMHRPTEAEGNKLISELREVPLLPGTSGGPSQMASYANQVATNTPFAFLPTRWEASNCDKVPSVIPHNSTGSPTYLWSPPSGSNSSQTKPLDLRYNTDSHLVNDSASFWTHHPGILAATPPQDPDSQYAVDSSGFADDATLLLWPLDIGIHSNPPAENEHSMPSNQTFQVMNQLVSNSESLSI